MKKRIALAGLLILLCALLSLPLWAASKNEINAVHTEQELTCGDCHDGNEDPTTAATSQPCIDCHTDMVDADVVNLVDEKGHTFEFWLHDRAEIHADDKEVPSESDWCITCHKQHEPTKLWCNSCHTFVTKVP